MYTIYRFLSPCLTEHFLQEWCPTCPAAKGRNGKEDSSYTQPTLHRCGFSRFSSEDVAISARHKSLKPGDRVVFTGIVTSQIIAFPTGDTQTINRIALTQAPHLLSKEKRISATILNRTNRGSFVHLCAKRLSAALTCPHRPMPVIH